MRLLIALPLILAAGAAQAQFRASVDNDATLFIDLPHGQVEITRITADDVFGFWAHAGGSQEIVLEGEYMPEWIETYNDSALLRLHMGTAACEAMYAWVTYDEKGLRTSGTFGTCAYDGVYEVGPDGASYTMDNDVGDEPTITYTLDPETGEVSNASAPWE